MRLLTTETLGTEAVRHGDIVTACAVTGANVLRDVREAITNTVGGKMTRYESVIDETVERALSKLADKAKAQGYHGVLRIQISHPAIIDGAIEVVVSGTGFWDLAATPTPSGS